jgi:polyisoprenoid-binding protein YceI
MSTATLTDLTAGTWNIDTAHSSVAFVARHLGLSKVRGSFKNFSGTIVVAPNHLDSSVSVTIDATSVVTGDDQRDTHLRSADFFDTETHKEITFVSTKVVEDGGDFKVHGNLTVHGTTRPVVLDLEFTGVSGDPWGGTRAGFEASTTISRKEFGVEFDIPLDGGGLVVGDKIKIELDVEAVKAA